MVSFQIDDGEHRRLGGARAEIRTGGTPMLPKRFHYRKLAGCRPKARDGRSQVKLGIAEFPGAAMIRLVVLHDTDPASGSDA